MNGSITKRTGRRGTTWYGRYDYKPITGKRAFKRVTAATKRECEALLREAIHAAENGKSRFGDRASLAEHLDQWLASVEPTVRPATLHRYADIARRHVRPDLGQIKLVKLTPLDLQRLYATKLESGPSATTVQLVHSVIHRELKQARRWGMVDRNVSELVDAPKGRVPDVVTWNAEQAARVLAGAESTDLAPLWHLVLLCGMRRGELLGLMWDYIDLERGTLAVRRTLGRVSPGAKCELGPSKSAGGRRSIALPPSCVGALRKHRAAQNAERMRLGPAWEDRGFVFTNGLGAPVHIIALMGRFDKLVKAAGVPRIRFHEMRHTCATLLMAQGTHPKIVQERLGHSDVSMTPNRYSHVTPTMQRQAADALDQMLLAARTGSA